MMRVLFLADSHLGTDLPLAPRVARRRRGHDFLENHARALEPALRGEVDLVVHGGDVFDRPRASLALARLAYEPLLRVADTGVPVFIVPGNHERGVLPHPRLLAHPNVHVFDRPRTFVLEVRGVRVALSGFPYERRNVRAAFPALLGGTSWRDAHADVRLLCMHHCVEGATVGPADYTFTTADDVIRCRDLPGEFAAVLSGHIHRHQVLTTDAGGKPLAAHVLYAGSIERTSSAEIGERKGYMILDVTAAAVQWTFQELPARPMFARRVVAAGDAHQLEADLRALIAALPADAVISVRIDGELSGDELRVISAAGIRAMAPATMNVDVRATMFRGQRRPPPPQEAGSCPAPPTQLGFDLA